VSRPGVDESLEWDFIKVILTKNQGKSKRDIERVRIRKSKYIKSDGTCCYTEEFNMALSLCRVLEVTPYFSKSFSEAAARGLAVTAVLQPLGVTVICFLGQESNLWSFVLQ